jgi:hypothetical protein
MQEVPLPIWVSRTLSSAAIGVTVAAIAMTLFFVLNWNSLGRGGQERVVQAAAMGDITSDDYLKEDVHRGTHQFNDCLIIGMALNQRATKTELTVSPILPESTRGICSQLLSGFHSKEIRFYHNYIHGHTMLARYFLPFISVAGLRTAYRLVISLVLLIGIGLCLFRIAKSENVASNGVFFVILLGFARFFGLESFGQSLGHGPSDLIILSYVVLLAFHAASLSHRAAVITAAAFGALTMIFEFLTGGLPLGIAAVTGLTWFACRHPSVRTVVAAATSFTAAAGAAMAIKAAAVWAVFGSGAVASIENELSYRISGSTKTETSRSFFEAILQNFDALVPGMAPFATAFLLISLVAGAWGIKKLHNLEAYLLGASNVMIVVWIIIFQQHTTVHAFFMDRILCWMISSGFALFLLACIRRENGGLRTPA